MCRPCLLQPFLFDPPRAQEHGHSCVLHHCYFLFFSKGLFSRDRLSLHNDILNLRYPPLFRQLYVEGQALVLGDEGWPTATAKGVQFEITGKGALQASDDTIVMGNLGYFQVKGDPGLYKASLKSGPSNDTFELATVQDLEVSSYITPPHQLRVLLREGKVHDDLFGPEGAPRKRKKDNAGGLFGALKSMLGGEDAEIDPEPEAPVAKMEVSSVNSGQETIHIAAMRYEPSPYLVRLCAGAGDASCIWHDTSPSATSAMH